GISARPVNEDLIRLSTYCEKWRLKVNNTKAVYTVFTKKPQAKQHITLSLQGTIPQKEDNPIYLGLQL
ncbi:unnamed protein product, partial [Lymnaea stagnalis]